MAIERCYWQLKRRFPLLDFGLRLYKSVAENGNLITAAVTVINFCKKYYDPEFNESIQDEPVHVPHNDVDVEFNGLSGSEKRERITNLFSMGLNSFHLSD